MKYGPHDIAVTERANCRRLILHYHPTTGKFTLSIPKGTSQSAIRTFLAANQKWIDQHAVSASAWTPSYASGEQHCLLGRWVTLGKDVPSGEEFLRCRSKLLKDVLQRLLDKWAPVMNVRITHVTLQEMSSRWGSCRPKTGRLTFNIRLALYEEAIIEETVVHELCHFFHADHSASFYREMEKYLPDWRMRKAAREKRDVRPRPPQ